MEICSGIILYRFNNESNKVDDMEKFNAEEFIDALFE